MSDHLEQEIKQIISRVLEIKPGDIQDSIQPVLQTDSVAMLEILLAIERKYGISISDEEAQSLHSLQQLIDFIRARPPASE